MQLDHIFILTQSPTAAASQLANLGLVEGTANEHPGQGTSNRRFFFSNTTLELLYIRDALEAKEGPGGQLQLVERAADATASPFGLIVRRDSTSNVPIFSGWRYQPDYFPVGTSFLVGDNSSVFAEPLCICMPDSPPPRSPQPAPAMPFDEVTQVRFHVPVAAPSPVLQAVAQIDRVCIQANRPHLLEVEFGHGIEQQRHDLRPGLPLTIAW